MMLARLREAAKRELSECHEGLRMLASPSFWREFPSLMMEELLKLTLPRIKMRWAVWFRNEMRLWPELGKEWLERRRAKRKVRRV